ncbi:MAG TPA: transcriptional regulator [Clostridiales bacterium]|nr:transcriptional regulator [Clostridiales bacterium]HBR08801.1 transcriptional regulator [Clostridiales bacterium]
MRVHSCGGNAIHEEAVKAAREAMLPPDVFSIVSSFFKVLGDETRIRILWALDVRELCVCDLAGVLGMTKSAVSHQLGTLRRAKLVKSRREGKTVFYSLDDEHVKNMLKAGVEHVHE